MKQVIILIPIYRSDFTEDELISVRRLMSIHADIPVKFVAPRHLGDRIDSFPDIEVEAFDDAYFEGLAGYNRLMLSTEFYARFSDYEYILIYQTDAYLFRNEIKDWCLTGFDYIGAPWLIKRKYRGLGRLLLYLRSLPHRLSGRPFLPLDYGNKVGNGGLSLRRVKFCLSVCEKEQALIEQWLKDNRQGDYNEDCFWGTRPNGHYPSAEQALRFSIDIGPEDAMSQAGGHLPMGCHGWSKPRYRDFWWPYITQTIR